MQPISKVASLKKISHLDLLYSSDFIAVIIYLRRPLSVSVMGQYHSPVLGFLIYCPRFFYAAEIEGFDSSSCLTRFLFFSFYVRLLVTPIGEFSGVYRSMHWFFFYSLDSLQLKKLTAKSKYPSVYTNKKKGALLWFLIINVWWLIYCLGIWNYWWYTRCLISEIVFLIPLKSQWNYFNLEWLPTAVSVCTF